MHSLLNVSNSSLEQWLQGSLSEVDVKDGKNHNIRNTNVSELKDEKKKLESTGLPPVAPPPAVSITTTTWYNKDINRTIKTKETPASREKGDTATIPLLDSESLQFQRVNEREMSEDERFIFDYGDFESDRAEGEKKKTVNGINQNLDNDNQVHKSESNDSNNSTKNERTRLLR